jgi:hypothetical protein
MNQPAKTIQLSQEEQGRLLARVYAFILSDQFTGTNSEDSCTKCKGKEKNTTRTDEITEQKSKTQIKETIKGIDTQFIQTQEPAQ